jgi:hemoglobin-like flavoprotein
MMTKEQIALVKNSWRILRDVDHALIGNVFYTKLFFDNPKLEKMFPGNMELQYLKLIDMLSIIVSRLDTDNQVIEDMKALARRHVGYGVRTEHYQYVRAALLWTIEKGLGNDWNEKIKEAWTVCYDMISGIMIEASKQV